MSARGIDGLLDRCRIVRSSIALGAKIDLRIKDLRRHRRRVAQETLAGRGQRALTLAGRDLVDPAHVRRDNAVGVRRDVLRHEQPLLGTANLHRRIPARWIREDAVKDHRRRAAQRDGAGRVGPAGRLTVLHRQRRHAVAEADELLRARRGATAHRAAVLRGQPDVDGGAPLEVTVADVGIAVVTLDSGLAAAELAAVDGPVVVVEAQEGDAAMAVLEQRVLDHDLGGRRGAAGQQAGVGEVAERHVPEIDLGLEAARAVAVMQADGRLAPAVKRQPDVAAVRDPMVQPQRLALRPVPYQARVAAVADNPGPSHALL